MLGPLVLNASRINVFKRERCKKANKKKTAHKLLRACVLQDCEDMDMEGGVGGSQRGRQRCEGGHQ